MSAPQINALSAIAFQLAATLQAYQADMDLLVGQGFDPDVYRRVSAQVDQMRMYAAALPPLSVAWVEVMIRHFELTHGLWRAHKPGGEGVDVDRLHAQLDEAVERLARKCVQLMPSA
ncbi:MAG: hypothetical protein EOO30_14985 [Comamonadaceae bacterium]|nr:MAG: hypothetical protein EOO30_14985 [Comamonadaceae bacterium]